MASVFRDGVLQGKVALITGGGSGINLAIAERYAQHGAKVALMGRTPEKLDGAVKGIEKQGGVAMAVPADVRDFAAVDAAFKKVVAAWGEVDLLVCGAAGNFPASALGMSANGFKAVVDIDLLGTFNTSRAAFEHLRKPGACIVNISATQAFTPTPLQAHVCAAKAGVDMLTRTLAIEWGPAGVRVNSIVPGPINDTEGMRRLSPSADSVKTLCESLPLQRYGEKGEIADLALFLASDAARYMTGAVVACDGGMGLIGSGILMKVLGG